MFSKPGKAAKLNDRTDASRRSYRSGVCTHPLATPTQSAAYQADGAVTIGTSAAEQLLQNIKIVEELAAQLPLGPLR